MSSPIHEVRELPFKVHLLIPIARCELPHCACLSIEPMAGQMHVSLISTVHSVAGFRAARRSSVVIEAGDSAPDCFLTDNQSG